jgi:hypothetical protein
MATDFLNSPLAEITSPDLLELVEELETVSHLSSAGFASLSLWNFLTFCVYPQGVSAGRVPLDCRHLPMTGFLGTRVIKLKNTDVYAMCVEFAHTSNTSLEFSYDTKLPTFLNRHIPRHPKPRAATPRQQQLARIRVLRRCNRAR